jgi:hypothetical protein
VSVYDDLVTWLKQQVGKPYSLSGRFGPDQYDCSGLVVAAYQRLGINMSSVSQTQSLEGQSITDYRNLQVGDLIFSDGSGGQPPPGHVKIYIGNGMVIQAASTKLGVIQSPLDMSTITSVRRVMDATGAVIQGDGKVPAHNANVGVVAWSQAATSTSGGSSSGSHTGGGSFGMPGSDLNPQGGQQGGVIVKPPSDGRLVRSPWDGKLFLFYDVGGVIIDYEVPEDGSVDLSGFHEEQMTREQFTATNAVQGGSALELGDVVRSFGTFGAFFDSILKQVMGTANPAANDPGVRRIIAEFASRPDMSPAELQNRLQGTDWYQQHTSGQLQWDEKPQAEKDKLKQDMAAQMASTWLQYLGIQLPANDPRIANYIDDLASGKMSFGGWIESVVKVAAQADPESPFSRQLRDEQENRKTRGIDIENQAAQVRQTMKQWGVQWSEQTVQQWAKDMIEKNSSQDDLIQMLKVQSQQLYPNKDPEMNAIDYATPWMETFRRVMEKDVDIFNPKVQSAMTAGTPAWEFEQQLKNDDAWMGTKNFKENISSAIAQAGRQTGFVK